MEHKSSISFLNKHNTNSNEFKLHSHDCYEVIYFLSGKGTVIIGDTSYSVSADTYCIIPPETQHTECLEGYGEILFIGFEYNNTNFILQNGVYRSDDSTFLLLLKRIIDEYKGQNTGYEIAGKALLDLLLVTYVRNTGVANKKCKDLDYIKNYIDQYFNQKISFSQLAKLSGYSYDYFRHIFKQRFGCSPQDYLIDIRLNNAKRLLENTNLSCTEIANNCGFSNSPQMTTMFKKKYKMSPTTFRITD